MISLTPLDSLTVDVLTDDVSDTYVSKTLFAVSEFANVILGGASVISVRLYFVQILGLDCDWHFLDERQCVGETTRGHDHHHWASDGFDAVSFASDQPLAVHKFQHFLDRDLPDSVFRGKGIPWVAESDARYIFHLVGKRFSLDESRWVGPKKNRLVLIGRNLDDEQLRGRREACLAAVSGS
jgi:G3E family GTPase